MRNAEINLGVNSMITFDDMPKEDVDKFKELVDQCILSGADDPEMKEGFKIIDSWANERGVNIYEMFLNLYAIEEIKDTLKGILDRNKKDGQ